MAGASRPSLTQAAYERLQRDLLACRYAPGERLRIVDLCEQLEVSQGAVREALSRLTSEGLVQAEPHRGFRVMPVSVSDLEHLAAARSSLEQICLRRSIEIGDIAWESRIVAAFHHLAGTPEDDPESPNHYSHKFMAAHDHFMDTLISACDNPWLSTLRSTLDVQSKRYRGLSMRRENRAVIDELRELMNATLAHDADRACSLLEKHITESAAALARALPSSADEQTSPRKRKASAAGQSRG